MVKLRKKVSRIKFMISTFIINLITGDENEILVGRKMNTPHGVISLTLLSPKGK